jgi:hypothetical protein
MNESEACLPFVEPFGEPFGEPLRQAICEMRTARRSTTQAVTETNGTHLVLFGMQNRTLPPCLAAINWILILVMGRTWA